MQRALLTSEVARSRATEQGAPDLHTPTWASATVLKIERRRMVFTLCLSEENESDSDVRASADRDAARFGVDAVTRRAVQELLNGRAVAPPA